MGNQTALIKVYEIRAGLRRSAAEELAEELLVQYSEEDYPEPDLFAHALHLHLLNYVEKRIRVQNLEDISVVIQANRLVGSFFESSSAPSHVKHARTFIVNLHYK